MGYQKYKGQWCTLYEGTQVSPRDRSGMPSSAGCRNLTSAATNKANGYAGGKWISAEDDARLHNRSESGWDHRDRALYDPHGPQLGGGAQLGVKLEELYHLWQQVFIHYYATPAQMLAQFEGRGRIQSTELDPFSRGLFPRSRRL